jgi:thiol-disulfide isomerase/thioredoxin
MFKVKSKTKNILNPKESLFLSIGFVLFLSFGLSAQHVDKIKFNRVDELLHSRNDTTYLINFWATWCQPCVDELPSMEKINSAFHNKKVRVILVSLDMPKQKDSKLIPFLAQNKVKSTVWLMDAPNANEWIDKVAPEWSGSIPASVIYNAKTGTKKFYEQSFNYKNLKTLIDQNL